jgi:ArsR family metal-binding transcriptional regulator
MAFIESIEHIKSLPCLAEPGKLIVIGRPSRPIDAVLPLVAAVAPSIIAFNPDAGTLTLRRKPGFITFRADRVMITQVCSMAEGLELLDVVRDLLNQCWAHRDAIQPVTTPRRTPRLLDIWTLLPQTNCKRCGEATCMAFAVGLLQQRRALEQCPVIAEGEAFAERRAQLIALV